MSVTVQSAPNFPMRDTSGELETVPSMIPAVAEEVFDSDIWLEEITLTNISTVPVSVTISDEQDSPLQVIASLSVEPGMPVVVRFGSRYCPGGVSWVATVAASLVGYMRGRR
jgi:hypothetical protein